jgi:polyribonucleotide nucleotidyltransferase
MHGVNEHSVSVEIGGQTLSFSTGKYAKQADGAVMVGNGDSRVLCTAVCGHQPSRFDFLPLTVDYVEREGAVGRIPGDFLKRDGRPNERTTLISRLIDRPIRPLFPKHFRNETQVICNLVSYDQNRETDVMALCGASAALHISDAPMGEAVAGVRVCLIDGTLVLNPGFDERNSAELNVVMAGTMTAITMVEGGGNEVSEEQMLEALDMGHAAIKQIVTALDELKAKVGIANREIAPAPSVGADITDGVKGYNDQIVAALATREKHARKDALKAVRTTIIEEMTAGMDDEEALAAKTSDIKSAFGKLEVSIVRNTVISTRTRIDGRAPDEIRGIWCEVGMAPRAHGSAIFTRGETQGFVLAALGTERDNQRIDWPGAPSGFRNWMLQYSFPPFSTGEARPLRGPKRREVGHGALAHRALSPVLPDFEDFPYVLRCTGEILESNGSSSMATVCGASLALMDAGVPLSGAVAGIAMGLIKEGDDFAVLSDILGDEDHLGDMDFKVTGTTKGITAFQMDVKISTVTREIMSKALGQAREGRLHILAEMAKTLDSGRDDLSQHAPRITVIKIDQDKIRDIIGPGGKMIRSIQEASNTVLTVEDDGTVKIAATSADDAAKATGMVRELTRVPEIGKLYMGVVKRTTDFGAFVEIFPGTDGLIHISHLAHERVDRVTDVVSEGDECLVRVIEINNRGQVRLSRKEALEAQA